MAVTKSQKMQILGAGGHAKVVIQTAKAAGFEPTVAFDDNVEMHGKAICGVPVLGNFHDALKSPLPTIIAVGNNHVRKIFHESLSLPWATIIHPSAIIDPTVVIGEGSVVFAGTVVQVDSIIGRHVIINTSASVDHDGLIADYVHLAPGCHLSGGVQVNEGTLLGVGSSVKPCIKIGEWSTIGVGSAVVSSIPDHVTAMGIPARSKESQ